METGLFIYGFLNGCFVASRGIFKVVYRSQAHPTTRLRVSFSFYAVGMEHAGLRARQRGHNGREVLELAPFVPQQPMDRPGHGVQRLAECA